jgi:hypothetical protein
MARTHLLLPYRGTIAFSLIAIAGAGGSLWYLRHIQGNNSNYQLIRPEPVGWKAVPHGPQTLFLYRNPKTGLLLRGAQSQIVAEFNPTPNDTNDTVAQYYVDRTHENLKGWTAEVTDKVQAKNGSYQIIDRQRDGKRVVSAFGVLGNSTFIVSLSGNGKEVGEIDSTLPWFHEFLSNTDFRKVEYPDAVASR